MGNSASRNMKIILALNCLALAGFAVLLWVQPRFTDLDVRMKYTQLDRKGVINESALGQFDPSYGFTPGSYRNSVPRHIAEPALGAQRNNALYGVALAAINLLIVGGFLVAARLQASPGAEAKVDRQ